MDNRAASRAQPADPSRRRFLKLLALTAGAAGAEAALPVVPAQAKTTEELAAEHAQDRGMLIDLSKCTGCGACVAACKVDNELDWREDQPAVGQNAALASDNWTVVKSVQTPDKGMRYVKSQCMHCLEPACASACFVKAMQKLPAGWVVYDPNRCVGCRYCLMACPFGIPTFDWDKTFPVVSKCNECFEDSSRPEDPTVCSKACPTGALAFGRRGDLLSEAHRRIDAEPKKYIPHVYGEKEAGGTSMLYISDVPFEELGFRSQPARPIPDYTWQVSRLVPPVGAGLAALYTVIYMRRRKLGLEPPVEDEPEEES